MEKAYVAQFGKERTSWIKLILMQKLVVPSHSPGPRAEPDAEKRRLVKTRSVATLHGIEVGGEPKIRYSQIATN
jgi:hypothetical protein